MHLLCLIMMQNLKKAYVRSRDEILYSSASHFSQFSPFEAGIFRKIHFSDFFCTDCPASSCSVWKKYLQHNLRQKQTWVLLGKNKDTFEPKLIIWVKRDFLEKFHLLNFTKLLSNVMQQSLEKKSAQDILDISMQHVLISSKSWPLTNHRTFWQTSLKS